MLCNRVGFSADKPSRFQPIQFGIIGFLVCVFAIAGNCVAQDETPSAQKIIERYIDALGSEMQLQSLQSYRLDCTYNQKKLTIHVHDGVLHWYTQNGKYKFWYDGQNFWQSQDGVVKVREDLATGYPCGFIGVHFDVLRWNEADKTKATLIGSAKIDGKDAWQVRLEKEGWRPSDVCFDKQTNLLLRTQVLDSESESELVFSYQHSELDDFLLPTVVTLNGGVTLKFQKLSIDCSHDNIDFDLPESLRPKDDGDDQSP